MSEKTIVQRFVEAFGSHDLVVLSELYSDDVVLYSPPVWGQKGKQAFLDYADGEFYSPDGAHGCFQFVFHWNNTGEFYGNPPTSHSRPVERRMSRGHTS
jgi:ketosteroid isomerase-like protein